MARRSKGRSKSGPIDPAKQNLLAGLRLAENHPLFAPLMYRASIVGGQWSCCPNDGWAVVTADGEIHVHPKRRAEPEEWCYVVAHCLLHLGFGHFKMQESSRAWNAACDCVVTRFLADLRIGRVPQEMRWFGELPSRDERALYEKFVEDGIPTDLVGLGTAGANDDMLFQNPRTGWRRYGQTQDWPALLRAGITEAVAQAVEVAAGNLESLSGDKRSRSAAQLARDWFISSYPLLGALAETFDLIEEVQVCQRLGISVAAVDIQGKAIYVNPAAGLNIEEARFVLAHELLHVGLRHDERCKGRDPYLWNVACDYVINGWLLDMQIGDLPRIGALHDPELKGLSAEAVYDRVVTDLRRYRKLATLAGFEKCDILEPRVPGWWATSGGVELDDFYRSALARGLVYHEQEGRGFLPAGLIEEIRALHQPAVPWDVELAQWFDGYFAPLEKRRTYARPSRRQSSTPDIPRPRWSPVEGAEDGRTFGVIIDTSGSMDRKLMGKALGAVASYAISREVPAVRVVFCDAATYDQGYLSPEAIAGRVKVRGRGGTVLQPGVTLLEKAEDFPRAGPVLIITDGYCDRLRIKREHAFLLPEKGRLPFVPKGPVFRMK